MTSAPSSVPATATAVDDSTADKAPTQPPFAFDPSVASFNVPLDAYLETGTALIGVPLKGICVGAFVFDTAGRLLLLQRAGEDTYPRRWEVPGGTIKANDESLLTGLARELREETGLLARCVTGVVGKGYTFLTKRPACICKYSFVVDVENVGTCDVKLNPKEHEAFLWVTEDEAKAKNCGEIRLVYTSTSQENAILESFEMLKAEAEV
ncbi:NUDIX hydrolase domain-like protein [Nemania abortiva]|nr:NUDIX hydrolase domain-like protein [Nemania abortiva]